jgi:hypothetical protein
VSIDTSNEESLFETVRQAVASKWDVAVYDDPDGRRFLAGVFGDVPMELKTLIHDGMPIARVTSELARFVPKTDALVVELNSLNKKTPLLGFGLFDESEVAGTAQVRASSSSFGDFITPVAVRQAVEQCVWPANIVLSQGFLGKHGGELALVVQYRRLESVARQVGDQATADRFSSLAVELERRSRAGDVGRYPDI